MSEETRGEIEVTAASVNGRPITLDPVRTATLSIPAREVESTIPCGFQQNWVEGTAPDGREFDLNVGAGVGSPWLTFKIGEHRLCVNVEDIVKALVGFADAPPTPEVAPSPQAPHGFDLWAVSKATHQRLRTYRNVEAGELFEAMEQMHRELVPDAGQVGNSVYTFSILPSITPRNGYGLTWYGVKLEQATWREKAWHVEWRDDQCGDEGEPLMVIGVSPACASALTQALRALPPERKVRNLHAYEIGGEDDPAWANYGWQ